MKNVLRGVVAATFIVFVMNLMVATSTTVQAAETDIAALANAELSADQIRQVLVGQIHSGESDGHGYTQDWTEAATVYHGQDRGGNAQDFSGKWKVTASGLYSSKIADWSRSYYRIVKTGTCSFDWIKVKSNGAETGTVYKTSVAGCSD